MDLDYRRDASGALLVDDGEVRLSSGTASVGTVPSLLVRNLLPGR